jgi:hypothetical protein
MTHRSIFSNMPYPQECICKRQMYIYNMNQTVQLHANYLLKLQSGAGMQSRPVDINHPDQWYTITKEKGKKN